MNGGWETLSAVGSATGLSGGVGSGRGSPTTSTSFFFSEPTAERESTVGSELSVLDPGLLEGADDRAGAASLAGTDELVVATPEIDTGCPAFNAAIKWSS